MLYFKINAAGDVTAIADQVPTEARQKQEWAIKWTGEHYDRAEKNPNGGWLCRTDLQFWLDTEELAEKCTKFAGEKYLATDAGEYVSPRFDVIKAPKVGDDVSKAFNGDYYPMGKIVKVSDDFKRVTVDGERGKHVFYRRKDSGTWLLNRTWRLVSGVHNEWNPEV